MSDPRTPAAAESYLRRALEALLDLGRHILAKGFASAPAEYKEVAEELSRVGVLSDQDGALLRKMAGYRNRLVRFYHEVSQEELYALCSLRQSEVEHVCEAILGWIREHPETADNVLQRGPHEKAYAPGCEDMRRRRPNIEKIRKLIRFEPKYDLEAMIQGVIDYFKEQTAEE